MDDKIRYVLGFAFDGMGRVLLIRKTRPEWQRGFLNGVGGKIEPGESELVAMVREFEEETTIETNPLDWRHFVTLSGPDFEVVCFRSILPSEMLEDAMGEEEVPEIVLSTWLHTVRTIANVRWLVPMAESFESGETCRAFQVVEVP